MKQALFLLCISFVTESIFAITMVEGNYRCLDQRRHLVFIKIEAVFKSVNEFWEKPRMATVFTIVPYAVPKAMKSALTKELACEERPSVTASGDSTYFSGGRECSDSVVRYAYKGNDYSFGIDREEKIETVAPGQIEISVRRNDSWGKYDVKLKCASENSPGSSGN